MLIDFTGTTTGVRVGLLAGFSIFARVLVFAAGFFLAGAFVAMANPAPVMNIE
jgi:hypothetical protein